MVALLRPQPEISVVPRQLRLVADGGHLVDERDAGAASRRTRARARTATRTQGRAAVGAGVDVGQMLMVVAAAVVIFGGLALLRASQGGPAADTWAEVGVAGTVGATAGSSAVVAAPGDQIVVAAPGDSFWSIARSIAPDADPRPVVAALIEANGSDSLQIGQQIVIPEQLLD